MKLKNEFLLITMTGGFSSLFFF